MKLRNVIFELAARYKLDRYSTKELQTMAGLLGQPAWLPARLPYWAAIAGAALFGMGLIFYVAANWVSLGRIGRMALLQGVLAASMFAAWRYPYWRSIATLVTTLSIGALLSCVGQSYPTGADTWQLFALWAALALPLCFAARSDILWMPWSLVVVLAIRLYIEQTNESYAPYLPSHVAGWLAVLLLLGAMSPNFRRFTGSGAWSFRLGSILSLAFVTESCYRFSFHADAVLMGMLLLGISALLTAQADALDLPTVAILALGFDLMLCAFAAFLLGSTNAGFFEFIVFLAPVLIATFAITANVLLKLHREGART